jgi:hypothetical protein
LVNAFSAFRLEAEDSEIFMQVVMAPCPRWLMQWKFWFRNERALLVVPNGAVES